MYYFAGRNSAIETIFVDAQQRDIILLRHIGRDDKQAFQELFESYFAPLCRFMSLYVSERETAEEIGMDIFMYIWEHRKTLNITSSVRGYLFKMARNRCLSANRKDKRTVAMDESTPDIQICDNFSFETEELFRVIEEAVMSLPLKCREVYVLSRQSDMTNQEVARNLNISVKTVEGQITKALKIIRERLAHNYYSF